MVRRSILSSCALIPVVLAAVALSAQESPPREIRGTVEGQGFSRIKIALPAPDCDPSKRAEAEELAATLREDLNFSGFFDVVDPALHSKVPPRAGAAVSHDDWLAIGADAVVLSSLSFDGSRLDLQARLHDNASKKVIFGRRYGGTTDLLRRVAHQLADELVQHYTGRPGVAMTRIAFVSKHAQGKEIYLMDYDGQRVRRLTTTGTINLFPVWSPDGERLAFVSWRAKQPGIHIMDSDGNLTSVPSLRGELNSTPSWSPDGKKLAFSSDMDGNSEIYVLTLGSKQTTRLTRSPAIDTSPAISPNGREIAFTSDRSGTPQIFVMGIDGLDVRRLSREASYNDSPAWAPRGDRIAYASRIDGRFQIVVHDIATGVVRAITSGNHNNEDPRWSPDGRHIVFSSNRGGTYDIYTTAADGSGVRRLTRGTDSYTPDWSP
jgi:TolB protein